MDVIVSDELHFQYAIFYKQNFMMAENNTSKFNFTLPSYKWVNYNYKYFTTTYLWLFNTNSDFGLSI